MDLSEYLNDVDNDLSELIITVKSEAGEGYVTVAGTILKFEYPDGIKDDIIMVTVSDGELEASTNFTVSIQSSVPVAPNIWDIIPLPWLLFILLSAFCGVFVYNRKKNHYVVYEAFLIHEIGLPVAHVSQEEGLGLEEVVVSGMFTAVQSFINDAFSGKTSDDDWELDQMKFGDNQILIERSKDLYLAVIFEGNGNKLRGRVRKLVLEINEEFGKQFEDWDGDMAHLAGVGAMISTLVHKKIRKHHRDEDLPAQIQSEDSEWLDEFERSLDAEERKFSRKILEKEVLEIKGIETIKEGEKGVDVYDDEEPPPPPDYDEELPPPDDEDLPPPPDDAELEEPEPVEKPLPPPPQDEEPEPVERPLPPPPDD